MKFSKLIQKYADKFAQLFSVLSFVVIILLGIVLLIQIAKEIIRLFQIALEPTTSDIYLMIDKIIVFFLLFEFFMIVISSLKNNGHVSITLLMGLGLTALLRNLLIIHDDYKNLILNIVGILLLIVGMAIYRYFVHAHIKEEDQQQIIDLWKTCFLDETEKSTHFYFQYLYYKNHTYILKNNSQIISALQIVPMPIMKNNTPKNCYFILGVCTHPAYQKQGMMKQLMQYVLKEYDNQDIYLQAYHPEIYRPFGFNASHYHQIITIDQDILQDQEKWNISHDYHLLEDYYRQFTKHFDEYRIRDESYWNLFIKRCESFEDHMIIFKDLGYLIYHKSEETIYISEAIYLHQKALIQMLSYFKGSSQNIELECDLTVDLPCKSRYIITMMNNHLNQDRQDSHYYINEVY